MENLQRTCIYVIAFTTVAVIHSAVSQRRLSDGNPGTAYSQSQPQPQPPRRQECGIQDKDQLPDFHAAAPWAAALFYVEGDFFRNEIKPQYLSTAIFISRNLAITSGSKILSQQNSGLQSKLQLYYGHRASGKQTLIRISKVEPLSPPRQPLALKVGSSSSRSGLSQPVEQRTKSGEHEDLYLLHLESLIDVTSFSGPLCLSENAFQYRTQFYREVGSTNKLHISGYAAKNEINVTGTHVVYFSSDREWRVQSWDTDYINVIMREHLVTYNYLPRHFNPGSALTAKINDQFFVVGILLRSSGSQTTFRSLEKFVELIQLKQQEYAPPPTPPPATVGLLSPYDSQRNSNGYSVQQQNSNNPRAPVSNVAEQIAHLEKSESEEKIQRNPSYSSQQQSYQSSGNINGGSAGINPNWESSTRSPYRPDLSPRPSYVTQRPEPRYTPQAQAQNVYNPNPIPTYQSQNERPQEPSYYGRQPDISLGHTTSTTTRYHSSQSQYSTQLEEQIQRTQDQLHLQLQQQQLHQQQQYQNQQNYAKCSQDYLEGVDIECISRPRGVSSTDCIKSAPVNTKIRLSCKPHYVSLDGDKILEKTCDASGNWLPRKAFACKLDCGTTSQSVPYIVGGSKTPPEKWPWHAALFKRVNQTSYTYICGATLITRSILVTAAHCVHNRAGEAIDKSLYKVVVGAISSNLLSNRKDNQAQEFDIKEIRSNKYYNPRNFEADIALVQIEKPVLLTDFVRPVCFPFPSDENKQGTQYQLSEGNSGIVVGFGTTSEDWSISRTLRMAILPVVSVKNCTNVLEGQPSSTQYCAGYTNGTSVCEGDSGGAHIFNDSRTNRYYVQGIISHGNRRETSVGLSRCDYEKYTVFTKVGSFAEWVKKEVYELEYDYNRRRRK